MMTDPLTAEQSYVLDWLHECEGLDHYEVFNGGREGAMQTLGELMMLGLACEVVVDGDCVGWIPTVKGYA